MKEATTNWVRSWLKYGGGEGANDILTHVSDDLEGRIDEICEKYQTDTPTVARVALNLLVRLEEGSS